MVMQIKLIVVVIRELKQPGRRPQRRLQKTIGLSMAQNLILYATLLFLDRCDLRSVTEIESKLP